MESSKAKTLAVVSHLGGLAVVCLLPLVIPFVIWIWQGKESNYVDQQAKEALNFQLSLVIYEAVCVGLLFTIIGIPFAIIGFAVFALTNFICSIIGAIQTAQGRVYKYPMNLRLIK